MRQHTSTLIIRNQEIPAETIEAVRILCPIERVAAEHMRLRRSGVQLFGRCPFHADKTPSFSVSPDKQVFYCHGCGTGGDVFAFVQLLLRCGFRDSVAFLAGLAGIDLKAFTPTAELRERIEKQKAAQREQDSFNQFANFWIGAVCREYRALARAATNAEDCLREGILDSVEQEMAWCALERYRLFGARIEREGLCDAELVRREWLRRVQHEAA